jgi:hypothetical protein
MPSNGNTNGRGGQGNGFTIEFISICKARLRLEELKPRAAPSSARKLLRGRQGSVRVRERGAMALLLADGIECTPELLYTTAEARTVIGCGTTRLYEFLASGKLRARRLGHRTLIEAKSLHESSTLCRWSPPPKCSTGRLAARRLCPQQSHRRLAVVGHANRSARLPPSLHNHDPAAKDLRQVLGI